MYGKFENNRNTDYILFYLKGKGTRNFYARKKAQFKAQYLPTNKIMRHIAVKTAAFSAQRT